MEKKFLCHRFFSSLLCCPPKRHNQHSPQVVVVLPWYSFHFFLTNYEWGHWAFKNKEERSTTGFIFVPFYLWNFSLVFLPLGQLTVCPRLDKCHWWSQIFPVSFEDLVSSGVLVSFLELHFLGKMALLTFWEATRAPPQSQNGHFPPKRS